MPEQKDRPKLQANCKRVSSRYKESAVSKLCSENVEASEDLSRETVVVGSLTS